MGKLLAKWKFDETESITVADIDGHKRQTVENMSTIKGSTFKVCYIGKESDLKPRKKRKRKKRNGITTTGTGRGITRRRLTGFEKLVHEVREACASAGTE